MLGDIRAPRRKLLEVSHVPKRLPNRRGSRDMQHALWTGRLPQNIELFSLHLDPGVQGNAREVAFGVGNVAYKSSSYGWDRRSNRNCGCLFYELRSELIVGTDRDHVDL